MCSMDGMSDASTQSRPYEEPRERLADLAYRVVKQRILDNDYPPGHQIFVKDLAGELQISRTPIREAFVLLSRENLVELVPRHGARVLPISPEDMGEIYEVLSALEAIAVELIVDRQLPGEGLKRLEDAVEAMERALEEDDLDAWAEADERFHAGLIALCGNSRLEDIGNTFRDQIHRARALTLRVRSKPHRSTLQHRELIEAIQDRDAVRAHLIHWSQRRRSRKELIRILSDLRVRHL